MISGTVAALPQERSNEKQEPLLAKRPYLISLASLSKIVLQCFFISVR